MHILSFRAFTTETEDTESGNPAGVVVGAEALTDDDMVTIAAKLGFSETAFLSNITVNSVTVRYFTPLAEIAFCGHATVASGVALARSGSGPIIDFSTKAGVVPVEVSTSRATLTAVDTTVLPLDDALLAELLDALRLKPDDLDPELPPAFIRGGNPHPLVPVRAGVLERLDHDAEALLALQNREGWDGTVPVVHRVAELLFESRNPFPRGGIREDPATGSAAAGLGYYLRAGGHVELPATVTVRQGRETGHPSLIEVDIAPEGRVKVSGTAEEMPQ